MGIEYDGVVAFGVPLGYEEEPEYTWPWLDDDAEAWVEGQAEEAAGFDREPWRNLPNGITDWLASENQEGREAWHDAARAARLSYPVRAVVYGSAYSGCRGVFLAVPGTVHVGDLLRPTRIGELVAPAPELVGSLVLWCEEHGIDLDGVELGWYMMGRIW